MFFGYIDGHCSDHTPAALSVALTRRLALTDPPPTIQACLSAPHSVVAGFAA